MELTIGALAQTGGVGVETIRFYQRRGLMRVPERAGAIRRYAEADLRRLRFIRQAQAAGFTLEAIGELLALDASHDRAKARALTLERIAELDAKIALLTEARTSLARLAHECGASAKGPCPIIEAFES
ncbi:MerR family DNA-binding protein [Sphingomonas sp. BIUV-7]|uniref:Mercuric resistance operon regulatory protein n=1 Tax=Sphingomonas natans TaxID=3063330 RepID=A0ABT8Y5S5_9SPHN|nr:MerR family transcriptional regulator [Sphingomonas sp. BIUV-7]MDO6413263.1 MerR family DNA-binding protein [Sphingomonas sp. BIUV-7]